MPAIASYSSVEPVRGNRWEYELFPEALHVRSIAPWETIETNIPLDAFSGEELRRTFRKPFLPWSDLEQGGFFCGCALVVSWLTVEVTGALQGVWQRWLFAGFGCGLMLLTGGLRVVRHLRHDWREWTSVEFRCRREASDFGSVAIAGDEHRRDELEQFLGVFRRHIQQARSFQGT
ncbi:hypothetical protein [Gemmata sp.]|uniref:hypothetical protein n=1 Tax=Gemmata sp. TaxID=1914242 RepID=UPI003F7148FF